MNRHYIYNEKLEPCNNSKEEKNETKTSLI